MELDGAGARWRYGVARCASLGLFAAAGELVALGFTTRLAPGADWLVTALACAGADTALAVVLGLLVSPLALRSPGEDAEAVPIAQMLAATAFFGSGAFFWRGAWLLWGEGTALGAVLFVAIPVAAVAFTYFLARWAVRQRATLPSPWLVGAIAFGVAGALGGLAAALRQPSGNPVSDATNVVLVTIDGLAAGEEGDAFRAFAAEGISFQEAVTPSPFTRAAHAAMLVGLHPLRTGVLTDDDVLSRRHTAVFEAFEDAGYATGAFLSDAPLAAGSGLEDGFGTWDDGFRPAWERSALLGALLGASGRREADATLDAFDAWLAPRETRPFAVWLHFADPVHAPDGRARADAALGRLRARLDAAGLLPRTVVVLAGSHGVSLGEPAGPLRDDALHVPLAVRFPEPFRISVVPAQVRLMDVANTLLDSVRLPTRDQSEGVALSAYGTGLRKATLSCTLLGRERDGTFVLGVRNNGVKVLRRPDGGVVIHDLASDPGETTDLSASQANVAKVARGLLDTEQAALDRLLRDRRRLP